jgi:CRP/FNR family transcriptional regulator, cyclic AMP receptor protein
VQGFIVTDDWIGCLPEPIRQAIATQMEVRPIAPGVELVRAGAAADAIFRVRSGFVKQTGLQIDGERTLMTIYGPGACFAETAMVMDAPMNHTTVGLTDAVVECLPAAAFWALYRAHSEIPDALCRKFAHSVRRVITIREQAASSRLAPRMKLLFAELARRLGEPQVDGRRRIAIPFTQFDLAAHMGVTRQSVQRELSSLISEGAVAKQARGWLVDLTKL